MSSFGLARAALTCLLCVASTSSTAQAQEGLVRVVVWDERQAAQTSMYEDFLGNHIAEHLNAQEGLSARSVAIDNPEQGLSNEILDGCDVLIWWGHQRHGEVSQETARRIVECVQAGELALVVLHSAHWSTPFILAMHERAVQDALAQLPAGEREGAKVEWVGRLELRAPAADAEITPAASFERQDDGTTLIRISRPNCAFPHVEGHGKPGRMRALLPDHPIAEGVPVEFDVPQMEMYGGHFHVPEPDAVVFEEIWEAGQRFTSACVWGLGDGLVFYYRPGHENFNVFHQPEQLRILTNAARWLGGQIAQ